MKKQEKAIAGQVASALIVASGKDMPCNETVDDFCDIGVYVARRICDEKIYD